MCVKHEQLEYDRNHLQPIVHPVRIIQACNVHDSHVSPFARHNTLNHVGKQNSSLVHDQPSHTFIDPFQLEFKIHFWGQRSPEQANFVNEACANLVVTLREV